MKIGNLSKVEAWRASTALPPGVHLCTVSDVREGTKNGNPELQIDVESSDGAGFSTDYMTLSENNLGRLKMFLLAVGATIPDGDFELNVNELRGRRCIVVVALEEGVGKNEGKKFPRVKGYKAVDAPADAAPETEDDIPF